jgi:hypothetical protein
MIRLPIVYVIAGLLLSCGSDKSKVAYHEIEDTTKYAVSEPPLESRPIDSPREYPFRLTLREGSNWNLRVDSVTNTEFDQSKREVYREMKINGDSLIGALSKMFKETIALTDSCCIFKGWDKDLKMCRRRPANEKEWTGFDAVDYDHGYLVVMESGYESWSYISFNPITRRYVYTSNEPRFITDDLIYSAGNYYTEGEFQINDVKQNKYFGFDSFGWELTGFYRQENSILMEFSSPENKKYLKVSF